MVGSSFPNQFLCSYLCVEGLIPLGILRISLAEVCQKSQIAKLFSRNLHYIYNYVILLAS